MPPPPFGYGNDNKNKAKETEVNNIVRDTPCEFNVGKFLRLVGNRNAVNVPVY